MLVHIYCLSKLATASYLSNFTLKESYQFEAINIGIKQ